MPQENGALLQIGNSDDERCRNTFDDAQFETISLAQDGNDVQLVASAINFGTTPFDTSINISDVLEYATITSTENLIYDQDQASLVAVDQITPEATYKAVFSLKQIDFESATPNSDPLSFDSTIQATMNNATAQLDLTPTVFKHFERTSAALLTISNGWTVVALSIILIVALARFLQIPQEMSFVRKLRQDYTGLQIESTVVDLPNWLNTLGVNSSTS